jgi:mRNA interferase RelE/StbE
LAWTIEFSTSAEKTLRKLDREAARRIAKFIDHRLSVLDDPRHLGKPLQGVLHERWSYRVGDYRLICELQDDRLVVVVIEIGHRREIYR